MANSGGIITAPVRMIADVKTVLGETSNVLSDLCKSSKINIKSKHKPISLNQVSPLTEQQRRDNNFGHTFKRFATPGAAIASVMEGDNFPYNKPLGYYRLGDFDGYDHNAGDWFPVHATTTTVGRGDQIIIEFETVDQIFQLYELSQYSASSDAPQFGFICNNSAFTLNTQNVYFYACTGTETLADISDKIRISTTEMGTTGKWYFYPVIYVGNKYNQGSLTYIRGDDTSRGGLWYPYPFSNVIEVSLSGTPGPSPGAGTIMVDYVSCNLKNISTYVYQVSNFYVTVTNTSKTTSRDVTISAYVRPVSGGNVNFDGWKGTVDADSSQIVCLQNGQSTSFEVAEPSRILCTISWNVTNATGLNGSTRVNLTGEDK